MTTDKDLPTLRDLLPLYANGVAPLQTEYQLVAYTSPQTLETAINNLLAAGWQLYGSPSVAVSSEGGMLDSTYAQAMTRAKTA